MTTRQVIYRVTTDRNLEVYYTGHNRDTALLIAKDQSKKFPGSWYLESPGRRSGAWKREGAYRGGQWISREFDR